MMLSEGSSPLFSISVWLDNVEIKNIHNFIEGVERGCGYGDKRGGSGVEGAEAGVEGWGAGIEGAG